MSQPYSIKDVNGGGVIEALNDAIAVLAANMADVNTQPDKQRELTLKVKFKPNKERSFVTITHEVTTKLAPQQPQEIAAIIDRREGCTTLFEAYADTNPNQHTLPGTMPGELRQTPNISPFKAAAANGE